MVVDIQNQQDFRNIEINKVGVKNIKYPIIVLDKKNKLQHTIAKINMFVNLPHHFKGTHMSRFIEILNEHRNGISLKSITGILLKMKKKLHAHSAHLEIEFPYFIEKVAPVSKAKSLIEYTCIYECSHCNEPDLCVGIEVPVTTLCPCSKEISSRGAHNQRSKVFVKLRFKKFFWIEDIIYLIENSASAEVYSLLKRQDEKYVTECAYDNPMFVEDVVRSIAEKLHKDSNIIWFCIESENLESIHNHNAYAMIETSPDYQC
ncbi:MAG: GTP cyclohydrolase FolE2 [Thermodesulfobacteriota bacterium]|nr:GTP cyclohydrolase FolE2 [Thermodesulfobacteriota bacterium]